MGRALLEVRQGDVAGYERACLTALRSSEVPVAWDRALHHAADRLRHEGGGRSPREIEAALAAHAAGASSLAEAVRVLGRAAAAHGWQEEAFLAPHPALEAQFERL